MYDLETVKETCRIKLLEQTDPYIPDPTDSTLKPTVLGNVLRGQPDKMPYFEKPLGLLFLDNGTEEQVGMNRRGPINGPESFKQIKPVWRVTIKGVIVMFVPGNNDAADTQATILSDVVGDFFKNDNALELPGVLVSPADGNSFAWGPANIKIENMKEPKKCLGTSYEFTIIIQDNLKHEIS